MKEQIKTYENYLKLLKQDLAITNKEVEIAENKAKEDIKTIKTLAEGFPSIYCEIKEDSTIAKYIREIVGVWLYPSYNSDFKKYTAQIDGKHKLFYAIRDNIFGFYILAKAEIKKDRIVLNCGETYKRPFNSEEMEIIKAYQNGRIDIKRNEEIERIIELVKEIDTYYFSLCNK